MTERAPELLGQVVVVIGGSAGIGLETARRARAEGAEVVLAARNPGRLEQAARELGAQSTAAFDANDPAALQEFFEGLPGPIDHVMLTGGGPQYKPPLEMNADEARRDQIDPDRRELESEAGRERRHARGDRRDDLGVLPVPPLDRLERIAGRIQPRIFGIANG